LAESSEVVAEASAHEAAERQRWRVHIRNVGDPAWAALLTLFGGTVLVLAGIILSVLLKLAQPALHSIGGVGLITGQDWDPLQDHFGALPFLYGTLVTSGVALGVALPVALGMALFVTQLAPKWLAPWVSIPVEILAAIPSVVYGLWGLFILMPFLRDDLGPLLKRTLGFVPLFQGNFVGPSYLAAGLILAVMILPTLSTVAIEVLKAVPNSLKEAALALGATRWEAIQLALLPPSVPGLLGATLLGLGRALGETMAVTMVIGNSPEIHTSLFAPGYSLPAVIANEFAEATSALHTGALASLGLILLGVSILLNASARLLVRATHGITTRTLT